jgi:hypothetical protein
VVIAKRESGDVTTVLDLRATASTVTPIPPARNPRQDHHHLRVDPMRYDHTESLLMMFLEGKEFRSTGTMTSAIRRSRQFRHLCSASMWFRR